MPRDTIGEVVTINFQEGYPDGTGFEELSIRVRKSVTEGILTIVPISQDGGEYPVYPGCVLVHPQTPGAQENILSSSQGFTQRVKQLLEEGYIPVNGKIPVNLVNPS